MRVLPSALEIQRGLLRRTPSLKALEQEPGKLILLLDGRRVELPATPEGEYYEAKNLYALSGPRPILELRPTPKGEIWTEVRTPEEKPRSSPPSPQETKTPEPAPPPRKKRVRLVRTRNGWKEVVEEEGGWPEPERSTGPRVHPYRPPSRPSLSSYATSDRARSSPPKG